MTRLKFLGNMFVWGTTFYMFVLITVSLTLGAANVLYIILSLTLTLYSFYKLLLAGYKRVQDIFPGKDLGLLLVGLVVVISIAPFGTALLLVLPGNLLGKKSD